MSLPLKALAHTLVSFAVDHLRLRFHEHKVRQEQPAEPVFVVDPEPKKIRRDHKKLSPTEEMAICVLWDQFEAKNQRRSKGEPKKTQADFAALMNQLYGCNKSVRTYMRIIKKRRR